jgi:hypothetical protein
LEFLLLFDVIIFSANKLASEELTKRTQKLEFIERYSMMNHLEREVINAVSKGRILQREVSYKTTFHE